MEEGIRALGPAPQGTGMMGRERREAVGEGWMRVKGRDVVSFEFENSAGREGRREEDTEGSENEGLEGRIGEVCKNEGAEWVEGGGGLVPVGKVGKMKKMEEEKKKKEKCPRWQHEGCWQGCRNPRQWPVPHYLNTPHMYSHTKEAPHGPMTILS